VDVGCPWTQILTLDWYWVMGILRILISNNHDSNRMVERVGITALVATTDRKTVIVFIIIDV
jgi:hypothetical protein